MSSQTPPNLSSLGMAPFSGALEKADLQDKSAIFTRLEEAIAFERACSSIDELAKLMVDSPWAHELQFRWRGAAYMSAASLEISVSPKADDTDLTRNGLDFSSIIDFAIAAEKLARGDVTTKDLQSLRQFQDASRASFILAARGEGFNAASALKFKTRLALCQNELSLALVWADAHSVSWIKSDDLKSNNIKKMSKFSSGKELADALGFAALGAEIERRALGVSLKARPDASPGGIRSL